MEEKIMERFIEEFNRAISLGVNYIAIVISMEGFKEPEVIINKRDNFISKLEYYKSTYNEELNHKHAKGIKIIDYCFGNSYTEIEEVLFPIYNSKEEN